MAATSPALPAFSYAQAAKGLAPALSSTQSQAESLVTTPDMPSTERKSSIPETEKLESLQPAANTVKNDDIQHDVTQAAVCDDTHSALVVKSNPDQSSSSTAKQAPSSNSDFKQVSGSTSPSLVASVAANSREDEYSSTPNGTSESWDKQSETSAVADKPAQMTDSGNDRNGDEEWVNVPSSKGEKELKAAPIPTVNIWQQRKEAQEAKAKASTALRSSTAAVAPVKPKSQVPPSRHVEPQSQDDETKKKASGRITDKGDGTSKKKQADEMKVREDGECPLPSFVHIAC
jgi:la-related protein 1